MLRFLKFQLCELLETLNQVPRLKITVSSYYFPNEIKNSTHLNEIL